MANLPATANKEKLKTFGDLLNARKDSFAQVLPKHIKVDRLIRAALLAMSRSPLLLQCTQNSLIQSMMVAAQLGLETDGVLGSAYLVPFRNNKSGEYEAQLIPGYRGLIDLARRSGQIKRIEARVVKEKDKFEFHYGLEPILKHVPCFPADGGNIIAAYAIAELTDGSTQVEVMSRAEIDGIRGRSKAKDSGPWVSDYGEMARKTVVRRLIKYLPLSVELARAIDIDNRIESGESMNDMIDIESEDLPPEMLPKPKKTKTEQIKEVLGAKNGASESPVIDDQQQGNISRQVDFIAKFANAKNKEDFDAACHAVGDALDSGADIDLAAIELAQVEAQKRLFE